MLNKKNFQTGDIYLVKFHPGYGNEFKKYRPAIVLSSKVTKIDPRFVLIAPLTTNLKTNSPDQEIIISNKNLEETSLLLTWYMRTIDSERLVKKIGTINKQEKQKIIKAVTDLFL